MQHVVVVGCGIVGAAIAYTLSQFPQLRVIVLDQQPPAQDSTGAALGVLMGAISQKRQGQNLRLRLRGIELYDTWVPQLEEVTGRTILYNRQGILRLCYVGDDLALWQQLADLRQQQGLALHLWDRAELAVNYPQLNLESVIGAVYAPGDRQIDPTAVTLALVAAAQQRGVEFHFDAPVTRVITMADRCTQVFAATGAGWAADWLVIAAGLGSTSLTAALQQPVAIHPVVGQAARIRLPKPLGNPERQPVITGADVHLIPLGLTDYWVGATVEMPTDLASPIASEEAWAEVWQRAIALCPALTQAVILQRWTGLRPRPQGRPAPVIERLPGYRNVILASGHYRNGVLLAPATAERVSELIQGGSKVL